MARFRYAKRLTRFLPAAVIGALSACRDLRPPTTPPERMRAVLLFLATCEFKFSMENRRYAEDGECAPGRSADTAGIDFAIVSADSASWTGRATARGVTGDCVYLAGALSPDAFITTTVQHRAPFNGQELCDGDAPTEGTTTWQGYVQHMARTALVSIVRRARQYREDHHAFPTTAAEVTGRPSNAGIAQVARLTPTRLALEYVPNRLPGVSCIIWDGEPAPDSLTTRGGRRSGKKGEVTCDDFASAPITASSEK